MDRQNGKSAAVIGSGFGGLATAIRLQAMGIETTLYEARDKPGGRAYVYEEDGHIFDAGPTVITAPSCIRELFEIAGRKLEDYVTLLPVSPLYQLKWPDGKVFDYVGDTEGLVRQIEKFSPADVDGYLAFMEYSKQVFQKGYEELAATPFLRFTDMIRVAPDLIRLRADRSVYSTISRFIKNEHLRQAFSFHTLLVGGNPYETSSIYTLIHYLERHWGVFFPRGGTGALVRALVDLFQEIGGEFRISDPVRSVTLKGSAVAPRHRVVSTESRDYDVVVSNADLHHTYATLYGAEPRAQRTRRKLERAEWSMSLFVLYFGTDKPYDIAHHTILFGPRYKELLDDIFKGSELADDFSLYLHAPTVTDPSLAPEGCGTYYVLSPVPHLGKAAIDWEARGPEYAERILAHLEATMPDLRQHIRVKRWFTPKDFQEELSAFQGSAFSVAPKLSQSAWFRPHNRDPRVPGLYIAGAGTHPGAGLPGVINSAKATAQLVADDLLRGMAQ